MPAQSKLKTFEDKYYGFFDSKKNMFGENISEIQKRRMDKEMGIKGRRTKDIELSPSYAGIAAATKRK